MFLYQLVKDTWKWERENNTKVGFTTNLGYLFICHFCIKKQTCKSILEERNMFLWFRCACIINICTHYTDTWAKHFTKTFFSLWKEMSECTNICVIRVSSVSKYSKKKKKNYNVDFLSTKQIRVRRSHSTLTTSYIIFVEDKSQFSRQIGAKTWIHSLERWVNLYACTPCTREYRRLRHGLIIVSKLGLANIYRVLAVSSILVNCGAVPKLKFRFVNN